MDISIVLGDNKVSNEDLAQKFEDWNFKRFERRVGIKRRYKSSSSSLDLALNAFSKTNITSKNLTLVYTTQTPTYIIPGDAHVFAEHTSGKVNWNAIYQLSNGCTGFVDSLILIKELGLKDVVVVNTDTYNSIIHPMDRMNQSLFSDCASVVCIDSTVYLGSSSTVNLFHDWMHLTCEREQDSNELINEYAKGSSTSQSYFWMNGPEVYDFATKKVLSHVRLILEQQTSRIDVIILHQANKMMLELFREEFQEEVGDIPINMENGNLVGCTIPFVLNDNKERYRKKNILLVGFGVGLKISTINIRYE